MSSIDAEQHAELERAKAAEAAALAAGEVGVDGQGRLLHVATPSNLPKCPSAPNIAHHKLDPHVVISVTTPSDHSRKSGGAGAPGAPGVVPVGEVQRVGHGAYGGAAKGPLGAPGYDPRFARRSPNPARQQQRNKELAEPSPVVCGQYRVLTPTMYRSHMMMANARQAVSMDYENTARARREGPSLRGGSSSPFQRNSLKQDSLDLELGASATGVHRLPHSQGGTSSGANSMSLQSAPTTTYAGGVTSSGIVSAAQSSIEGGSSRGARAPPAGAVPAGPAGGKRTSSKDDDHSDSSMVLDLHVEGAAPITLLVRDESRSTRSTSGNRETTNTTITSTSLSRSPQPPSPPSLIEQMSCESSASSSPPRQIEETSIFGRESLSEEEKETKERKRIQQRRLSYRQSGGAARNRRRRNRRNSDPSADAPQPPVLSEDEEIFDVIQRSTSESELGPKEEPPKSGTSSDKANNNTCSRPAKENVEEKKKKLSLALQVSHADQAVTVTGAGAAPPPVPPLPLPPSSSSNEEDDEDNITPRAVNFKPDTFSAGGGSGQQRLYTSSKSYEEPCCATSPFGEVTNARWSKSLAEELASISFIDANVETSPEESASSRQSPRQRSFSGGDLRSTSTSSSTSSTTLMVLPAASAAALRNMKKSHTHHSLQQYTSTPSSGSGALALALAPSKSHGALLEGGGSSRRVSGSSVSTLGQLARHDDGPTMMQVDGDGEEEELFMEIAEQSATPPGEGEAEAEAAAPLALGARTPTADDGKLPPLETSEDDKDVLAMVTSYSQDHQAGMSRRHLLKRQAKVEKEKEDKDKDKDKGLLQPESEKDKKKRSKTLSF